MYNLVSEILVVVGSGNGLLPKQCQAITWTHGNFSLIWDTATLDLTHCGPLIAYTVRPVYNSSLKLITE